VNVHSNFDFGNSVSHYASFTKSNSGPRASDNNNYGINNNQPAAMALASASNVGSNKCSKEKVKAVEMWQHKHWQCRSTAQQVGTAAVANHRSKY